MEYQAYQEAAAATDGSQVAELQRMVNNLMLERGGTRDATTETTVQLIEDQADFVPEPVTPEEPRTKLVKVPGKQRRIRVPI